MRIGIGRVDIGVVLRNTLLADQWLGQPVGVMGIVEAKSAFDAQPVVIGRPIFAFDRNDPVVLDLVGELAADPAIGTDTVDFTVGSIGVDAVRIDQSRRHQGTGRASLHAFAASDAGAVAHRVVEVEDDLFVVAARGHPDHVVDLDLAACAHTEIALDTSVELHRHRRMATVGRGCEMLRKAAFLNTEPVGPLPQPRVRVMRHGAVWLVADQQLEHHLARKFSALAGRLDLHT